MYNCLQHVHFDQLHMSSHLQHVNCYQLHMLYCLQRVIHVQMHKYYSPQHGQHMMLLCHNLQHGHICLQLWYSNHMQMLQLAMLSCQIHRQMHLHQSNSLQMSMGNQGTKDMNQTMSIQCLPISCQLKYSFQKCLHSKPCPIDLYCHMHTH